MAARLRAKHQDEVRLKIQTSQLINRVQDYAMGKLSDEEVSSNRLNAIKLLLSKSLPDLQSVEITGEGGGPLQIVATPLDEQL
jgi:hypothetical protein